jgi:hypothetical protein
MPAPSIYWWHMPQNLSQQEGIQRARAVLATTATGTISDDDNGEALHLVTSEFHAIINCVGQGDHDIFTIMIVAGDNDAQTRAIMEEIRTGMRGGPLD